MQLVPRHNTNYKYLLSSHPPKKTIFKAVTTSACPVPSHILWSNQQWLIFSSSGPAAAATVIPIHLCVQELWKQSTSPPMAPELETLALIYDYTSSICSLHSLPLGFLWLYYSECWVLYSLSEERWLLGQFLMAAAGSGKELAYTLRYQIVWYHPQ